MPTGQIHLRGTGVAPREMTLAASARLSYSKDTGPPAPTRTYPLTVKSVNTLPPYGIPATPPLSKTPPNEFALRNKHPARCRLRLVQERALPAELLAEFLDVECAEC